MNDKQTYLRCPFAQHTVGFFRVLHTTPHLPSVDIYFNDKLIAEDIHPYQFTKYMPVIEGTYKLSLFEAGSINYPILDNLFTINKHDILTIATSGKCDSLGFLALPDANIEMEPEMAMVSFTHLAANTPSLDITLPDGTTLFENVAFNQVAPYIPIHPSSYTIEARRSETKTTTLVLPDTKFEPNNYYTIYTMDSMDEEPNMQALVTLDSNDYIESKIMT